MNETTILSVLVVGVSASVALLIVACIILGRAVHLVWRANRRLAEADQIHVTAMAAYWSAQHTLSKVIGRG